MSLFDDAFAVVLKHEAGFQNDPNDTGNWTGGGINVGKLMGTKYGISAASYPKLDIANLSVDDARLIYARDFWTPARWGDLPPALAIKAFDTAVATGPSWAVAFLQRALRACGQSVTEDARLGQLTIDAVNRAAYSVGPVALVAAFRSEFAGVMRVRHAGKSDLAGLLNRAYS